MLLKDIHSVQRTRRPCYVPRFLWSATCSHRT